jgi:hypothetical protein
MDLELHDGHFSGCLIGQLALGDDNMKSNWDYIGQADEDIFGAFTSWQCHSGSTRGGAGKVKLQAGKRGTYTLMWMNMVGWNPVADGIIKVNDPLPARPWLALCGFRVVSPANASR